ncbi:hypothetical protein BDC45DRAFT_572304 [Circinella umbellata]|nr:hypothetical protein BDC45DRAFT_572304 [Circinella umbellata]
MKITQHQQKRVKHPNPHLYKTKLTSNDKTELKAIFENLDSKNFWYLKSTIPEQNQKAKSVEERMIDFALNIQLSLNNNLPVVSGLLQRKEIEDAGCKLLRPVDISLNRLLSELYKQKTAKEAYQFARNFEFDPEDDPLLVWLSSSIQDTALLYLKKNNFNIQNYLESDKLYYLWGFSNKIFDTTYKINVLDYDACSKEKSSTASAFATNQKRELSAVDPVENSKMGRRTDTAYIGGNDVEVGCLEIGKTNHQTKEFMDGSIKMPIAMKDMLMKLVEQNSSLVNQLHILGYLIMGKKISLMDMDIPKGYVTRIRRTKQVLYPDSSDNFVVRIGPLLELAAIGKEIAEDTYKKFSNNVIPLSAATDEPEEYVIPPHVSGLSSLASSPSSHH